MLRLVYVALLMFLWLKMCLFSIVGTGVSALCVFIKNTKLRIGMVVLFGIVYIPIWCEDLFLTGFYYSIFGFFMFLSELLRRKVTYEGASNSLKILLFSMSGLLLIDFSLKEFSDGIYFTYIVGEYTGCLYRIFSIFLISESIRALNLFIKDIKISALVILNSLFLLGSINYWTTVITNKPFTFSDFYLAKTAAGVLEGVHIERWDLLYFLIYIALVIIFNILLSKQSFFSFPANARLKRGIAGFVYLSTILLLIFSRFLSPLMFDPVTTMGFPSHLVANLSDSAKPEDYDAFIKEMDLTKTSVAAEKENKDGPNIIAIMSEAFSDLSQVGEHSSASESIPYIRQLMTEYPSGTAYSSVWGNNTCSSEYEFLTGISTGMTEPGAIIYQKYLEEGAPSIVSLLENQNYHTVGIHPYKKGGYNRYNAWQSFGFDEMYFDDEFKYPKKVRGFISDESFYDKIIDTYEKKGEQPLFCFGISMQNHATYKNIDEYLSLLQKTDAATQKLIEYFEKTDEDTVIIFFGDHQPMIDKEIYEDMLGTNYDDLDLKQRSNMYKIPYFVWTNYDTNYEAPQETSFNYLPNILLDIAGLEKDQWFGFVDKVAKKFPVVTDNFFKIDEKLIEKSEMVDVLDDIKVSDRDHPYYLLKQYQVWCYYRAIGDN